MAEFSAPFADGGGKIVNESQQRAYYKHLGDGIINAATLDQGKLVADGSTTVRLNPTEVKLQGLYYKLDSVKSFNLATLPGALQPSVGQSRIDAVVWRLDVSDKIITAEVVTGVPSATPVAPQLADDEDRFEKLVHHVKFTGAGVAQSAVTPQRSWIGPHLVLEDSASLPPDASIGSTAERKGLFWTKISSGVNGWTQKADRSVVALGRRSVDGKASPAAVAACSVRGLGRQVSVDGMARLSLEQGAGNVTVWITVGDETAILVGPFSVAEGEEKFISLHGKADAPSDLSVQVTLRASVQSTQGAVLNSRSGSHVRAESL